jgi:EPS-associated MarR family transcriptional regulator
MDEPHFKTLLELARDGKLSQRDLAKKVGLSLGRINFIVNSLIKKGYLKAQRFKNSRKKLAYMYVLTPSGLKKKVDITKRFVVEKTKEYERLKFEISELKREMELSVEFADRKD